LVTFAKSIKLHKRPGQDELTIHRHPGIRDIWTHRHYIPYADIKYAPCWCDGEKNNKATSIAAAKATTTMWRHLKAVAATLTDSCT